MLAQRALRAPMQMAARGMRPTAFRAAAIAPFSTKQAPVQTQVQQQSTIKNQWFAPPPAPGKHMVRYPCSGDSRQRAQHEADGEWRVG